MTAPKLFISYSWSNSEHEQWQRTHRFFENLIPYMQRPMHVSQYAEWDFDNFRFLIHELFLYVVAILIRLERFQQANQLPSQQYYLPENSDYDRDTMVSFTVFSKGTRSLEHRNQRLNLNRLSLRADILEQRSKGSGIEFKDLMQADFVLFMRAERDNKDSFSGWWPDTLLYVGRHHRAFEIFARPVSKSYFDRVKCLLEIEQVGDLNEQLEGYKANPGMLPRWRFDSFSPSSLLGFEQLCKKA